MLGLVNMPRFRQESFQSQVEEVLLVFLGGTSHSHACLGILPSRAPMVLVAVPTVARNYVVLSRTAHAFLRAAASSKKAAVWVSW